MRKTCSVFSMLIFISFCACSGGRMTESVYRPSSNVKKNPNEAVTAEARTYSLGRTPDQALQQEFYDHVMISADEARKEVLGESGTDVGFNYTITPRGAVYPFSDVETACIIKSNNLKSYGRQLCSLMFSKIETKYQPRVR